MSSDKATDSPEWNGEAYRDNEQAREHEKPDGTIVDGYRARHAEAEAEAAIADRVDVINGDDVRLFMPRHLEVDEGRRRDNLPTLRIAEALVAAQRQVRGVEKSKQAGDGGKWAGYKFASAEAIITEARAALHSAGLAVLVPTWREVERDRLELDAMVVHSSGDVWAIFPRPTGVVVEGKGRPRDKAIMAAMTYATQYLLRGLLQIPRPDEGQAVDERDDRDYQPRDAGLEGRELERQRERVAERQAFKGGAMLFAGKHTGKPIVDASDEGLRAHIANLESHISMSATADVHPHMVPHIAELEAELEGRAADRALAGGFGGPTDDEADRLEAEAMQAEANSTERKEDNANPTD